MLFLLFLKRKEKNNVKKDCHIFVNNFKLTITLFLWHIKTSNIGFKYCRAEMHRSPRIYSFHSFPPKMHFLVDSKLQSKVKVFIIIHSFYYHWNKEETLSSIFRTHTLCMFDGRNVEVHFWRILICNYYV